MTKVQVVVVDGAVSVWRQGYDAMIYSEARERDGADVSVIYDVEVQDGETPSPDEKRPEA
jgi:hypothetical protein